MLPRRPCSWTPCPSHELLVQYHARSHSRAVQRHRCQRRALANDGHVTTKPPKGQSRAAEGPIHSRQAANWPLQGHGTALDWRFGRQNPEVALRPRVFEERIFEERMMRPRSDGGASSRPRPPCRGSASPSTSLLRRTRLLCLASLRDARNRSPKGVRRRRRPGAVGPGPLHVSAPREFAYAFPAPPPARPILDQGVRADGRRGVVVAQFTPSGPVRPALMEPSLTMAAGSNGIAVSASPKHVRRSPGSIGAQRLAVLAVGFSRCWSVVTTALHRRSERRITKRAAPCGPRRRLLPPPVTTARHRPRGPVRESDARPRAPLQGAVDADERRPSAASVWPQVRSLAA